MPIFEYKCEDCGEVSDILILSGNDGNKIICDKCKSENVKKLIPSNVHSISRSAGNDTCTTGCCPF
ncbi:zinc ribbon domain-containing protein [bacterium]|nr:zinc ribbon domain-containing protein [bacterium]